MKKCLVPLLTLLALTACQDSGPQSVPDGNNSTPTPAPQAPVVTPVPAAPPVPVGVHDQGSIDLAPTPAPEVPAVPIGMSDQGSVDLQPTPLPYIAVRGRKRMNIDQLDEAIKLATGGIGWTQTSSSTTTDLFQSLSATLGKPDYLQNTQEDLSASLIFEKFLGDAANSVCRQLVDHELSVTPDERVLMVYVSPTDTLDSAPLAVEDNLVLLLRRFHSRNIDPGSPELEPWSWLFESATFVSGDPTMGWRAVCVSLIEHPDFFSF